MKAILLAVCILFVRQTVFSQQAFADSLNAQRVLHETEFLTSVLDSVERDKVKQLCYFPPNLSFKVVAQFIPEKGKKFPMPMSNRPRVVYYRKIGIVQFNIDSTVCRLTVYENLSLKGQPAFKNYAFLPFRDATSGIETYGGGRYLDLTLSNHKWITIDFNEAYHPYCAYSSRYSCPIVPAENKLTVPIRVGECYNLSH